MLNKLIKLLIKEIDETLPASFLNFSNEDLFRALCNIRLPIPANKELIDLQNKYLHVKTIKRGIVHVESFEYKNSITLWQGDITRLKCDAIVNACNSQLLGCFAPLHNCIDNVIHTNAGIQVRIDCNTIMQGQNLPNGEVIVTSAYNLPSKYIFHTVGPIVENANVTKQNREDLKKCYINSLEKAKQMNLKNIVFCGISTGVYGYPKDLACKLAVATVKEWLKSYEGINVVFNVFSDEDRINYERELSR